MNERTTPHAPLCASAPKGAAYFVPLVLAFALGVLAFVIMVTLPCVLTVAAFGVASLNLGYRTLRG